MPSLIISRYSENLSWLIKYNKNFEIIIYNKGDFYEESNFKKIIKLPNVGRESHTWLYHIVNNYHNLDDKNIFLQGRIDDLDCMVYKNLNNYLDDLSKYNFSCSRLGLLGPFHWSDNLGIEKDPRYAEKWKTNQIKKSKLGFRKFAKNLFPNIPYFVATSYGGCFGVTKGAILSNKRTFYCDLLEILSDHDNPIEGHYMERLWCYIFTKNKPIFRSFKDVIKSKIERIKKLNN